MVADLDLSNFDIDQCDTTTDLGGATKVSPSSSGKETNIISAFKGTHKCHKESSLCQFVAGQHWRKGSYQCLCKKGYFSTKPSTAQDENESVNKSGSSATAFNGSLVEGKVNKSIGCVHVDEAYTHYVL